MHRLPFALVMIATLSLTLVARAERLHRKPAVDFSKSDVSALAFNGTIDFAPAEVAKHQANLGQLIRANNEAMQDQIDLENSWFNSCNMGVMYGYVSPYAKMTAAQRQAYVAKNAKCAKPPPLKDVGVTSCEIFTNKFLSKGFAAVGQADVYKRINAFLNANDRDGLALVFALRKLGWKTLYWNTDIHTMPPLPKDRSLVGVTPDDHLYDMKIALTKKYYHGITIDGFLTDFSPNPGSKTVKDDSVMAKLRKVPYVVGISHAGFHVWSASYGTVTESHSFFDPADRRNIQIGEFEPQHASPTCRELVINGKNQTYCYYSGVIAVPPGPWNWL